MREMTPNHAGGGAAHFLSVYMQAPDITALTIMRHDLCAALWRQTGDTVTLQRYWEFERFTGLKHHRLPLRRAETARAFLDDLLAEEGLSLDDMAAVWGTPHLSTDAEFAKRQVPAGHTVHSMSHLFSAIGMDWRLLREGTILGLALDAGPDFQLDTAPPEAIYSGCVVDRGEITVFPIESPGPIWLLARGRFGREEGTLMALCSATTCSVEFDVRSLVDELPFRTQAEVFHGADTLIDRTLAAVTEALATPHGRERSRYDPRFDLVDNVQSAVMKLLEEASFRIVDRTIDRLTAEYDLDLSQTHLGICGGYALNCPNNSRLMDKYGFRGLLAPPCANDGGQALGLGLMALHDRAATAVGDFRLRHAFHGRQRLRTAEALAQFAPVVAEAGPFDVGQVVTDLITEPVAWVRGPAEIGPRALGHRSILGDPRRAETKDVINRMKGRQWWRPVAPIVLEEHAADWFETDRPSPFMLEVFRGRDRTRDHAPAVLHLDGTARVQTMNAADDETLHEVISAFHALTGVPILANTSLNDRGEPLVDSAAETLNFCVRKGLRVAYLGDVRVVLRPDAGRILDLDAPHPRRDELFTREAARWSALWSEWTAWNLSPASLFVYAWNPRLRDAVDPFSATGARTVEIASSAFLAGASDRERRFVAHLVRCFGPTADPIRSAASDDFVGGG
ncbi:carbamoyltransferase C-terminal domain-containing protein [Polymorphospora lycopeni]|uniref:Carbamoyltransferase C-terminal domain-containing protein n=1 Tax=Polymorphospora lycopeni TaxID=3140240 RepID=A0ABV5CQF4_9ACTN